MTSPPPASDERTVIATIVGTVLVVAAAGTAWIWRQARRRRGPDA